MNKGSVQNKRISVALNKPEVSIGENSVLDRLMQTLQFAGQLPFIDIDNKVVGTWKTFLMRDPVFIIASIINTDLKEYKDLAKENEQHTDIQNKLITDAYNKMQSLVANWVQSLTNSRYEGVLLTELKKISSSTENFNLQSANNKSRINSEQFENLYGHLLFIKEKATVYFKEELIHSHHQPHIALLLTFFKLLKYSQNDLNALTKEHLDFYYKKVLKQSPKHQEQSNTIIQLKVQQGIEFKDIPENESFNLTFPNKSSIKFKGLTGGRFTQTEIADIKTLFKSAYYPFGQSAEYTNFALNKLYQADIVSEGKSIFEDEKILPATFGEEKTIANNGVIASQIGIMFSSPALILEKGKQSVDLSLKFTPESWSKSKSLFDGLVYDELEEIQHHTKSDKFREKIVSQFFAEAFQVLFTSNEGWNEPGHIKIQIDRAKFALIITIQFLDQEQTLIPFNPEIHDGNYETIWPCIKLMLNNDARYHPYRILSEMVIEEVTIETEVNAVENLNLSTSLGNIDNSIPFAPFGTTPVLGSYLKIQNPLILQQNLTDLEVKINWLGLPKMKGGFESYYRNYPYAVCNKDFKIKIKQSSQNNDHNGTKFQEENLFQTENDFLISETKFKVQLGNLSFDQQIRPLGNKKLQPLILELSGPEFAFGHQQFPEIYANAAMNRSRFKKNTVPLPSQPFTPMIEKLTVRYKNLAREIMHRKLDSRSADIKIVHVHPFGKVQVFPGPVKSQSYFLPQISTKGNLLIGLKKFTPNEILNLGFDLQPAVYNHTVIKPPKVEWHYLSNNEWLSMHDDILEDSTQGLLKSGIIRIKLPGSPLTDNSIMPEGKLWIKASYKDSPTNNSRIKKIFSQALQITSNETPDTSKTTLDEQQVKLKVSFDSKPGIAEIKGPFALETSNRLDSETMFYYRTSEMLRHKNRAVTNWDIERLILDKFPQIEKVRAYGRSTHPKELVQGSNLQIVLIPKSKPGNSESLINNKIDYSTLSDVKKYITQFLSPWAKIEVSNPIYELLKVKCMVKFKDPFKAGYLKTTLNNEIVNYLAPNAKTVFTEKGFDESFSKTELINFIESRPYVEFITEFSVLQLVEVLGHYKIIDTALIGKINELRTISPYAILTSAPEHHISVIANEEVHNPQKSGIGDLAIDADFVISDGKGNYT